MALLTGRGPTLRPRTLILIGLFALVAGIWELTPHAGFLSRMASSEADVVSVETFDRGELFPLYRATLRFETPGGDVIAATAPESYRPTAAGERLSIGYDAANPSDARLMDPRDRWLLPAWLVLFGIVTLFMGARRAFARQSTDASK